jgi:Dna[CI] antecedent DciA-like protein
MEPVGDSVSRELGRFGATSGAAAIADAWPAAVGGEIARNAWPARVMRDGTLVVHASSATWAFELGHLEGQIRESLGSTAPPKLRFIVGPLPEPAADEEATPRNAVEPSDEDVATAAALASPIADENLRKIVAKAAALSLASAASDRSLW